MDAIAFGLAYASALGSGLMAGLFFIFSNTVMRALGRQPAPSGAETMQAVNGVILNPLFLVVFMGTALLGALAAALWLVQGGDGAAVATAGAALYLAGVIGVTFARNVPMNDELDAVDPRSDGIAAAWSAFLGRWTAWNHVRTVASTGALACFVLALSLEGTP